MNEATLRGCRDKADRADQLTQQVHTVWEAFLRTHPYPWWVEADLVTGCYRVFYDFSEPPPVRLAVITGEWVHNLRSALAWSSSPKPTAPRRKAHRQ